MLAPPVADLLEHLTPHDLVAYSRCPREMQWHRLRRTLLAAELASDARVDDSVPIRVSPLLPPSMAGVQVVQGRFDGARDGLLVYVDPGERDLPMVFPPERIRPDPVFHTDGPNLVDREWELSGRPDLVVRGIDGGPFPVEYKSTHLFVDYHSAHGRTFDVIQAVAECRLVHAVTGTRPRFGIIWYGDAAGEGEREGWVSVPYDESRERWLKFALDRVREDHTRAPVPNDRNCSHCEAHRDRLCRWGVGGFEGPRR